MQPIFFEFNQEVEELVVFLTAQSWDFFGTPLLTEEAIRASYERGYYASADCRTDRKSVV